MVVCGVFFRSSNSRSPVKMKGGPWGSCDTHNPQTHSHFQHVPYTSSHSLACTPSSLHRRSNDPKMRPGSIPICQATLIQTSSIHPIDLQLPIMYTRSLHGFVSAYSGIMPPLSKQDVDGCGRGHELQGNRDMSRWESRTPRYDCTGCRVHTL
jgi:hypothetical protein